MNGQQKQFSSIGQKVWTCSTSTDMSNKKYFYFIPPQVSQRRERSLMRKSLINCENSNRTFLSSALSSILLLFALVDLRIIVVPTLWMLFRGQNILQSIRKVIQRFPVFLSGVSGRRHFYLNSLCSCNVVNKIKS